MRVIIAPAKKMNTDLDSLAPEDIKVFADLDYRYSPAHSSKNDLVFIRGDRP